MENASDIQYYSYISMEVTEVDWIEIVTTSGTPSEAPVIPYNHSVIVASMLIVVAVIGLFGNALVVVSFVVFKKLQTITNVLVVNLAIADFIVCASIPFQSANLLHQPGNPFHDLICATLAAVGIIGLSCSVSTIAAIAFIRWYVITKSVRGHQGFHTPKKIAILVIIIWIESITFMIVPLALGVVTLGYSEFYSSCTVKDTSSNKLYYSLLQGTLIVIFVLLTLTFYLLILRHVLRHNKRFHDKYRVNNKTKDTTCSTQANQNETSSSTTDSRPPMIKTIKQKEIEITKNLFTVVCAFILCLLGAFINLTIPGSSVTTLYSTVILLMNSVVNPIIYGLKHPNFREAFKKILCCRRIV